MNEYIIEVVDKYYPHFFAVNCRATSKAEAEQIAKEHMNESFETIYRIVLTEKGADEHADN